LVTTTSAEPSPAAVVNAYYAALNTSDAAAAAEVWPTMDADAFAVLTDGVSQRVSVSCTQGSDPASTLCQEYVERNDFTDPAGVFGEYTMRYRVDSGSVVDREIVAEPEVVAEYVAAFGAWLEATHPDVFAANYIADRFLPFATVEDAAAGIALVDEFLAESDDYPLGA
jgi:hypothetical protein